MPSAKGPRLFNHRSSSPQYLPRKPLAQIVCLLIGISGLLFGFVAISKTFLWQTSCKFGEPRSVSVVWQTVESSGDGGGSSDAALLVGAGKRYKVMGFVGIFTGFGSVGRRRALRQTWLPPDRDGLQRLEEATGLAFRFIIGRTSQEWKMSQLKEEVSVHDDFVLLDIEEEYI
uniref:Uncharacterized protein n=1 Tax=Opuntia streptacantha TaxID=393608 RepID=A0A7C9E4B5_OPUST